jgi:hypothetical protein
MLTCHRLRTAVLLSALLLIIGLVLEAIAEATPWSVPTSHLALFSVLTAATILGAAFLTSLLPGTARRLAECQH